MKHDCILCQQVCFCFSYYFCVLLETQKNSVYKSFQMSYKYCNFVMKCEDTKKKDFVYVIFFERKWSKINILYPKETRF